MSVTATTTQQLKQGTAKFWIVLVGVNRYFDSNILNLKYCANDCKELAEALEIATGEFQHTEIISLYDSSNLPPERSQIINSIQQFRWAKPEDTVLFYFSGHGYLDSNNCPVLCVADTRLDNLAETGLKLDFLLNELSQCRAQRQLVWLDACQEREQQLDSQTKQNPTQQLSAALEEQARKSQNFYAMLSCDKQERSWEIEELRHGLFTYCLIEGLRGKAANSKNQIDADGLFDYVERMTSHIIEDRKNPGAETSSKGMMINVQQIKQSSPPLKTKRLPANASQTPKRIVQGGGKLVFLIGLAAPINNRKALIIDRLSNSEATIGLCKLLQAQGNFAVEYRYLRDKQQWQLQQDIIRYLVADNRTILLYLSGTIESTADRGYELVCDWQHRINLNWLAQQLTASPVKEIVVIANITKATETTPSLELILQLNYDLPLCLIEATSHKGDRQFLARLVTTLSTAAKAEKEFWVTDLISPLQKWSRSQPDIEVTGWWGTVGLIEILSVEVQRSYNQIFDIEVCPYKSLEAFTQEDAYFFHGRSELVNKIVEKLKSNSFLAVVGASGSGKSSVVRAGVIPKLVANGLNTSQSLQTHAYKTWVMLPGDNPFIALARAISPNEPELIEGVLHAGVKSFVDWLHQQPQAISVLAIDQFEELFTLTPEKERIDFIRLIIAAVERAGDCFKVIITLRGDFINECLNLSEIAPLMEQNEILVLVKSSRLEDEQYRQIIAQPAQKVGLEVEDGLMAVLLEELKDGSLPLLQYALEELWQKRREGKLTLKDYQQYIGRLGQFLSEKAEATYQNLNQLQQECAQSIFLSLVYLAQEQDKTNKDTRRRLLKSDLRVNKYKDTLDDTLQTLVDARLIVVSGEDNSSVATKSDRQNALAVADELKENTGDRDKDTVEIAHEILIDNWKTLKWWLDNNRDKYRLIREINQSANKWKQYGFVPVTKGELAIYEEFYTDYADELSELSNQFMDASIQARDKADKLDKRRQRQIIGGLTGGIVAISMVAGAALWQLRRATINEVNALVNSTEALLLSDREFDALITGLRTGKKIQNSFINFSTEAKIKLIGRLQNILHQIDEFNRLEGFRSALSPDGKTILTASWNGKIKIWSLEGKLINAFHQKEFIYAIRFSPDGKTIATANSNGIVRLWSINGKVIKSFKAHTNNVNNLLFSPNGKIIASSSFNRIKLWNIEGELIHTLQSKSFPPSGQFRFAPDSKSIIILDKNGSIKIYNIENNISNTIPGEMLSEAYEKYLGTNDIVKISPNGLFFATARSKRTISGHSYVLEIWNMKGKLLHSLKSHQNLIQDIDFHPSSQIIASSDLDGIIKIWSLKGELIHTFEGHNNGTIEIEFSPNGKLISSSGKDNLVKLWNSRSELLHTFEEPHGNVKNLEFSPDSSVLISSGSDTVRLWNIEKRENLIRTFKGHESGITKLIFSPNEKYIASYSRVDGVINIWNKKGDLLKSLEGKPNAGINNLSFSFDDNFFAFIDQIGSIKFWNLKSETLQDFQSINNDLKNILGLQFNPNNETITIANFNSTEIRSISGDLLKTLQSDSSGTLDSMAYSPNSQFIASARMDNDLTKTIRLWKQDGNLLHRDKNQDILTAKIFFSPDSRTFATYEHGIVKVWSVDGQLVNTLGDNVGGINDIAYSPDSKLIAFSDGNNILKLWNLKGELIRTFEGHTKPIMTVNFSPDGKIIASGDGDGNIKLWSVKGDLLHTFEGHKDKVNKIEFIDDGKTIASASDDKTVKLWSLDLDEVMSRGCDWARDYLTNNPNVSEEDRKICDGY